MAPCIGIDLGTTYSCVAVCQGGKVEIIPDNGERTIPSWVSFCGFSRLVGAGAKVLALENPENTVFDMKRFIGRKCDDPVFKNAVNYPFKVEKGNKGNSVIEVECRGQLTKITPEQISGLLLKHMKNLANEYLKESVKRAVITVPAYFNDSQRQATKDAGRIAGLEVLAIINEPTAAAIAYGLEKNVTGKKNVLIFDFGGGTCDVSILVMEGKAIRVKAVAGNSYLGGRDIDEKLLKSLLETFNRKSGVDASTSQTALHRLREACEKAKRTLSSNIQTRIYLENFFSGHTLDKTVTREGLNGLCKGLFIETIDIIKSAMTDAKLVQSDIDDIVMVGGSSYIPEVKKLVSAYFDHKPLTITINPDESVAYGAAVHAALLGGDMHEDIKDILLMDVTPLSLGIERHPGIMSVVVKRNTPIPCCKEKDFFARADNQSVAKIAIFQGERTMTKDNLKLWKFKLTGIPAGSRQEPKINVKFSIDTNGILSVTATVKQTGESNKIDIEQDKGRLSEEEINMMIDQAKMFEEEDLKIKKLIEARMKLERVLSDAKFAAESASDQVLLTEERDFIVNYCNDQNDWLDDFAATANFKDYKDKIIDANSKLKVYMAKLKIQ